MKAITSPLKWKAIPGFAGYEVSNTGRVRSFWQWQPGSGQPASLGNPPHDLVPDFDKRGRSRYTLRANGKSCKRLASRLVLLSFVGPCPSGMECCHNNGNEVDNELSNLRWDTHSANLLDRRGHGTAVCGEMVNTAKLTKEDIIEIRSTGYPLKPLAERYGVSETLISLVLRRKVWQHVK